MRFFALFAALVLAMAARADARALQQAGLRQTVRINSASNAAKSAITQAVRGTITPGQAADLTANAAGLVTFGSYPAYYIQNDAAGGYAGGFYTGNTPSLYDGGEATGKR